MGLLTVEQMSERIKQFIYRDGWQLEVYQGAFEGPHLKITTSVPDSTKPGEMMTLDVHSPRIPPMTSFDQFDLFVQDRLIIIEIHECREFFRLKETGKAMFYPHLLESDQDRYDEQMIARFKEYRGEENKEIQYGNIL